MLGLVCEDALSSIFRRCCGWVFEDATNDANTTATRITRGDNVRVAALRERKPISLMQLTGFKVGVVVQTLVKWFVLVMGT